MSTPRAATIRRLLGRVATHDSSIPTAATLDTSEVIAFDRAESRLRLRGLAHSPAPGANYELQSRLDAPVVAIRYILGLPLSEPVPPIVLRLGTTRGTNALITRRGARTALVTTRGFGDVLEIGYQARPRLFDLTVRKPPPLTIATIEIDERVTHTGEVLTVPREADASRQQLESLRDAGIESLAICLLHADRHPAHEQLVARLARDVGFTEISASHEAAPLPKIVARADTTVVDAYLNPVLREYVERLAESLPGSQIRLLTSAGGLVSAGEFRGKDSILSGPAGGVVGFSRVAAGRRLRRGHRLRHGRHQHRRRPFRSSIRRPLRVGVRNAEGRRAARRADDGDRNRRGRRRLDLPLRRREAGRRARRVPGPIRGRPATVAAGR